MIENLKSTDTLSNTRRAIGGIFLATMIGCTDITHVEFTSRDLPSGPLASPQVIISHSNSLQVALNPARVREGLTINRLCTARANIYCTFNRSNGALSRICFTPAPDDRLVFKDADNNERAINYEICSASKPDWITCANENTVICLGTPLN